MHCASHHKKPTRYAETAPLFQPIPFSTPCAPLSLPLPLHSQFAARSTPSKLLLAGLEFAERQLENAPMSLDDHLCNALSTERLTAHKLLLFQPRQRVARSCEKQHNRCSNQAAGINYDAQPLNQGHDTIDSGAHVVRGEAADEGVELCRCRADSQEERDFDENEDQRGATARSMLMVIMRNCADR